MGLHNCGAVFINKCTFGWFFWQKSQLFPRGLRENVLLVGFLAKVTVVP